VRTTAAEDGINAEIDGPPSGPQRDGQHEGWEWTTKKQPSSPRSRQRARRVVQESRRQHWLEKDAVRQDSDDQDVEHQIPFEGAIQVAVV